TRLRGIDVPDQPVRIAEAQRPDFFSRALDRNERVVVGDAIAPVLADRAGGLVFAQVRDDAQDLSVQRVEPLRVHPADVFLFAGARVTGADVHHTPVGIAAPGD